MNQDEIAKYSKEIGVSIQSIINAGRAKAIKNWVAGLKYLDYTCNKPMYWQRVENGYYDKLESK
jgi:hypothetical protein